MLHNLRSIPNPLVPSPSCPFTTPRISMLPSIGPSRPLGVKPAIDSISAYNITRVPSIWLETVLLLAHRQLLGNLEAEEAPLALSLMRQRGSS
jgi:hypothetical protein